MKFTILQKILKDHYQHRIKFLLLSLIAFIAPALSFGQVVFFGHPGQSFNVCQTIKLEFKFINNTPEPLPTQTIRIIMPCGTKYQSGSVSGLTELNISDLNAPEFTHPLIPPNGEINVHYIVLPDCDAHKCLDNKQTFYSTVIINPGADQLNFTSELLNLLSPHLVITNVEDAIMSGTQNQVLKRKITIKNTRFGRLSEFRFADAYTNGVTITTSSGVNAGSTANLLQRTIGAQDFLMIGNHDEWFDHNESIIIEESIAIEACAFEITQIPSIISVSWGCETQFCQSNYRNVVINVSSNVPKGPVDSVHFILTEPACPSETIATQYMTITNHSKVSDMENVTITLENPSGYVGFIENSIMATMNGMPVNIQSIGLSMNCSPEYALSLIISFPNIPAGQSVLIQYDLAFCRKSGCFFDALSMLAQLSYQKSCTVEFDKIHTRNYFDQIVFNYSEGTITAESNKALPATQDDTISFTYTVDDTHLLNPGKFLYIEFNLPCAFQLLDTSFILDGKHPIKRTIFTDPLSTTIQLLYPLPLSISNPSLLFQTIFHCDNSCVIVDCDNKLITSCLSNCPDLKTALDISAYHAVISDINCPPYSIRGACPKASLAYECSTTPCPDTLTGYFHFDFTFQRTNVGLPDNNNDYQPDPGGQLDYSAIRLDRAISGDTLLSSISGMIVFDKPDTTLSQLHIQTYFNLQNVFQAPQGTVFPEFFKTFQLNTGIFNYANQVRIIQKSTGKTFLANYTVDTLSSESGPAMTYIIDAEKLHLTNPGFPADYRFQHGDSVFMESYYIILYYPQLNNLINNFSFDVGITMRAHLIDPPTNLEQDRSNCICRIQNITVSSFNVRIGRDNARFDFCDYEINNYGIVINTGVLPNFFPNEYRPTIDSITRFCMPAHRISILNARITSIRINSQITHSVNIPIPIPDTMNSLYCFDITDFVRPYFEEMQEIFIRFDLQTPLCERVVPIPVIDLTSDVSVLPLGTKESGIELSGRTQLTLQWPYTYFGSSLEACNQEFENHQATWNFTVTNCGLDNPAFSAIPRLWLRADISNDALSDITVSNATTGIVYNKVGNWYDLGIVAKCDTQTYTFSGSVTSCNPQLATFYLGWGCNPPIEPSDLCNINKYDCNFRTMPGILDMMPNQDTIRALLCDTMPYIHAIYMDADIGALYALKSEIKLPQGLQYLPGSSQISWPDGTPYMLIPDPQFLPNNTLLFDLSSTLLPSLYLPGVLHSPANVIALQFLTVTDCDFISGSKLIYNFTGEQLCGRPLNAVARPSGPLMIEGLTPPYDLPITVIVNSSNICENEVTLTVSMITSDVSASNDKLTIELPQGIIYKPGSVTTNLSQTEPDQYPNKLEWPLQPGLNFTNLSVTLILDQTASCTPLVIPVYSSIKAATICQATFQTCDIDVITGSHYVVVPIEKPAYIIESFTINSQQGAGVTVVVSKTGGPATSSGSLKIFLDKDKNGVYSQGDLLLDTRSFLFHEDGTITIYFANLSIAPDDYCDLVAFIDGSTACACDDAVKILDGPFIIESFESYELCYGEAVTLSIDSIPGAVYLWEGDGLSCNNCTETIWHEVNETLQIQSHTIILNVSLSSGCSYKLIYHIHLLPKNVILENDVTVCKGNTVTLLASGGEQFEWAGTDIISQANGQASIYPQKSGWYFVTITDSWGCTSTDSAFVNVIELSNNIIPPDVTFCIGSDAQLTASYIEGYTYFWSNANGRLVNPNMHTTKIKVLENYTYHLYINYNGCSRTDSVQVKFVNNINLDEIPDTLSACLGDTVYLSLPAGLNYSWSPSYTWLCNDPACAIVTIPITQDWMFNILATDSSGCTGTHSLTILATDDLAFNLYEIDICEGLYAIVFGDTIYDEGRYCDTLTLMSGCMKVTCYDVAFSPEITISIQDTICEGGQYEWGSQILSAPGVYCDSIITSEGCLEIRCLTLMEKAAVVTDIYESFCEGSYFIFGNDTLDKPGIYQDTISDQHGCNEIIRLELSIDTLIQVVDHVRLCPGDTILFYTLTITEPGLYCHEIKNPSGCDSLICLDVVVDTVLFLEMTISDTTLCINDSIFIMPIIEPDSARFMWNDSFPNLHRWLLGPQLYSLRVWNDCGDELIDSIHIRSFASIMPNIGDDITICDGDSTYINLKQDSLWLNWYWNDNYPELDRPFYHEGSYFLFVLDSCGQWGSDTIRVQTELCRSCEMLALPNVFTPNNDGTNDIFRLLTDCPVDPARMRIYNRWGQVIYDDHPVIPGWDGTFKNEAMPMEVYAYVIEFLHPIKGEKVIWRGDVTLVR